jgi:hypothetical protein
MEDGGSNEVFQRVLNKYLTIVAARKCMCTVFCQKEPSLLFRFMFFPGFILTEKPKVGKKIPIDRMFSWLEQIYYHNPDDGYNHGKYIAYHILLLPLKLIKSIIGLIIFLIILCFDVLKKSFKMIVKTITSALDWVLGSKSENKRLEARATMINNGHADEIIAHANPKKLRAPVANKTPSITARLKEIAVETANLEVERLKLEERLQTEEEAQASSDSARVYRLKASNGG